MSVNQKLFTIKAMELPLVSCIMPTYNRREFIPHAIKYFQQQDYENKELIIIDDGSDNISDLIPDAPGIRFIRLEQKITLGAKLNMACLQAQGSIIVNWDDDDWYAPRRLTYQVETLLEKKTGVCGINKLLYYDLRNKKAFQYIYPADQRTWLLGSSLCYTKHLWNSNRFADIDVGMDGLFVWNTSPDNVTVLDDHSFSVHMIHNNNVSPKQMNGSWWHPHPVEEIQKVMGTDWHLYSKNGNSPAPPEIFGKRIENINENKEQSLIKNIHACLVHENEDCIIDLVRNLHYHDPESTILLYNGGEDASLFKSNFPYNIFGAVICPKPVRVKWGYLHHFALHCMQFALDNYSFDTLTIVDSDQLCIRKGYTQHLSALIRNKKGVGMLSSIPEKIDPGNRTNPVAMQAYKEYDLWKPLLQNFPDGENKFVHWTFWPSTVFTSAAAKDLVKVFKENKLLQEIMKQTKIWATEEVILPTMVSLLGYEIALNPCSYDFVKYKVSYNTQQAELAIKKTDVYWIHPVERKYDHPVRKYARQQSNHYISENNKKKPAGIDNKPDITALLKHIEKIEGWLSLKEAELLIETTINAGNDSVSAHSIVEVGSYHGKATVLLGTVAKKMFPAIKVFAIDPHDGKLGAIDQGLILVKPSFEKLKDNMRNAGLSEQVEIIKDYSYNVKWDTPVSFLLIDGLHDYPSVARDFRHFSGWINPGGYVAFHDYADYYPGVKAFVEELLESAKYRKVQLAESLIILQKV